MANGLERFGFRINRNKVSIRHRGQAQIVTGIVVNESPRPADIDRRTLRAMRHRVSRGGDASLKGAYVGRNRYRGYLAYWHMVDLVWVLLFPVVYLL